MRVETQEEELLSWEVVQNSEALGGDPGPAAPATPGSLLELQRVRLLPGPAQSVFILARFQVILCTLSFENHRIGD